MPFLYLDTVERVALHDVAETVSIVRATCRVDTVISPRVVWVYRHCLGSAACIGFLYV